MEPAAKRPASQATAPDSPFGDLAGRAIPASAIAVADFTEPGAGVAPGGVRSSVALQAWPIFGKAIHCLEAAQSFLAASLVQQ